MLATGHWLVQHWIKERGYLVLDSGEWILSSKTIIINLPPAQIYLQPGFFPPTATSVRHRVTVKSQTLPRSSKVQSHRVTARNTEKVPALYCYVSLLSPVQSYGQTFHILSTVEIKSIASSPHIAAIVILAVIVPRKVTIKSGSITIRHLYRSYNLGN